MPKRKNPDDIKIYTFDFETDPFKFNRVPLPFCVGVSDGKTYEYQWGDERTVCDWIIEYISNSPPNSVFFAHNGGKFDFHYILDACQGDINIIGARIVSAMINGREIRDSYALLPFSLDTYQKTKIDYAIMEPDVREQHKDEILKYLKDDCFYLHDLVSGFVEEFGLSLTAAGAAIKELTKFHTIDKIGSEKHDARFRRFYFGGRVECFKKGVMPGKWKVYDVNSMYPHVMDEFEHPISAEFIEYTHKHAFKALDFCDFAVIYGESFGALPYREEGGGLSFPHRKGKFFVTGHELRAALELGLLRVDYVEVCYKAKETSNFSKFVQHFYTKRLLSKKAKDKLRVLFYKLILNSAYGKLAQDPRNFKDWKICYRETGGEGWTAEHFFDNGWVIYGRPTSRPHHTQRWNIAGAASITGAARSVLLRGLHAASNPIYCDTDSIICENLPVTESETKLGAWKCEGEGDYAAIAGKKMYALFDGEDNIKLASKGVRATPDDIVRLARGEEITYNIEAPAFRIKRGPYDQPLVKSGPRKGNDARFISRTVRQT